LKNLPLEFHYQKAKHLASIVGMVLEEDLREAFTKDPRFYVSINLAIGYVSTLLVANVQGNFFDDYDQV